MFRSLKNKRAARRLVSAVHDEAEDPLSGLLGHDESDQREILTLAVAALTEADSTAEDSSAACRSLADRLLELDPDAQAGWRLRALLATADGRTDEAIDAWQRALPHPAVDSAGAAALLRLLVDAERLTEATALADRLPALDPDVGLIRAELLHAKGDSDAALDLLDALGREVEAQMGSLAGSHDYYGLQQVRELAGLLRADIVSVHHGRESAVVQPAMDGKLDARAGVNYQLLAESLMVGQPRRALYEHLLSPEDERERAQARLRVTPDDPDALVLLGSAELRSGHVRDAAGRFEKACSLDGRCFGAFLGLAAVMDERRYGLRAAAARLPHGDGPSELSRLLPDLDALTDLERHVVRACSAPLAPLLSRVTRNGAWLRILPMDMRATDLRLFSETGAGERTDDHRSPCAIGGLATAGGAVARVGELIDVVTDGRLTFAHELAHLVYFHGPDGLRRTVERLYERATAEAWAFTQYQLGNPDEFFAEAYRDFLTFRYRLPDLRPVDDAGLLADVLGVFDRIGRGEFR